MTPQDYPGPERQVLVAAIVPLTVLLLSGVPVSRAGLSELSHLRTVPQLTGPLLRLVRR